MHGKLVILTILSFCGRMFGEPIIDFFPDAVSHNFKNVSMHCEYNLNSGETMDLLIWLYGETPICLFSESNPDDNCPLEDWADRLAVVEGTGERHYMILNGSWCDSQPFKCQLHLAGGGATDNDQSLVGIKDLYTILLNGTVDITNSTEYQTNERNGFIWVHILWNDEVVLSVTKDSDEPITANGTMTGSDSCTREAEVSVDFELSCGGKANFFVEAQYGYHRLPESVIEPKIWITHMGPPSAPADFIQDTSTESSDSVTVWWSSGCNGGSSQTFELSWKNIEDSNYTNSEYISDSEDVIMHEVTELRDDQSYDFRLVAINDIGESSPEYLQATTASSSGSAFEGLKIALIIIGCSLGVAGMAA